MHRACVLVLALLAAPAEAKRACDVLEHGVRLPDRGETWLKPPTWAKRGLSWGTKDLVGIIERSAARVAKSYPGTVLYVADLSPQGGGPSSWHKTHRRGVDADLLFFALDAHGARAAPPTAMIVFDADGHSAAKDNFGNAVDKLDFDTARNWALVRALLADKVAVHRILISSPLRQRLLDYAAAQHEPAKLVARAAEVLHQPMHARPHDDHMHLKIESEVVCTEKPEHSRRRPTRTRGRARH
jgi:murein endopeptidase